MVIINCVVEPLLDDVVFKTFVIIIVKIIIIDRINIEKPAIDELYDVAPDVKTLIIKDIIVPDISALKIFTYHSSIIYI